MTVPVQIPLPLPPPQPGTGDGEQLAARLLALIERRGRPLEVGHIAAQLLRLTACPQKLQRRLVAEVVDADARLAWHGQDLVGIAPHGWSGQRVEDATFCVVDLETTGGSPGGSKITEIGAVRVECLNVVERFSTLVNPERPIPPVIAELTGITSEMVEDAPSVEEAIEQFSGFAGDAVLVAHNAPFDLRFLNYERRRIFGSYFTQPWLDTLVLSRRLLQGRVERHNLGALAEWADTRVRPCHRALPDAEATAEVLAALVPLLHERGATVLQDAVQFGTPRVNRFAHKLALAEDLPSTPGVYLMRDAKGEVLYVGKAANLRRRVRSYFGPGGQHSRRIGRALAELDRVDHEPTGSEFEALLRESELICDLKPPCNRRGIRRPASYLKLTVGEAYPRLLVVKEIVDDDAAYFGPLRSERQARRAVEALTAAYRLRACHPICAPRGDGAEPGCESGPCGAEDPERYGRGLADVVALLQGNAAAPLGLTARLAEAFATRRLQHDRQEHLEQVQSLLKVVSMLTRVRRIGRLSAVVVEPAVEPGTVNLFFIGGGKIVHRTQASQGEWRAGAEEGLGRIAEAEQTAFDMLDLSQVDVATVVEERLSDSPAGQSPVRLGPGWSTAETITAISGRVRAIRHRAETAPGAAKAA